MAEPKPKRTKASVAAFLKAIPDAARRRDCIAIKRMMERATRSKGAVNRSRVLVYKLGATKQLPKPVETKRELPQPPALTADAATVTQGHTLYMRNCMVCHGDRAVSGSSLPDLRYMSAATHEQFDAIVLGGIYWQKGMVGFGDKINKTEADAIHQYLIKRSRDLIDGKE